MRTGIIAKKVGMTRVFSEKGEHVPVTVLQMDGCQVVSQRTLERDGYTAVQVTYGERRATRVTKPQAGHFAKAGVEAGSIVREFRVEPAELESLQAGAVVAVSMFEPGQKVDVHGTSIGKGFAGTIKRHNFNSGRASHGNSRSHNVPGSIGMAQDPGRVFPGKRMSGHLGAVACTVQNLEVARVDAERGLLLVRGAVPGARNGNVVVTPAVRTPAAGKRAGGKA